MDMTAVLARLADDAFIQGVGGTNTPLGIVNRVSGSGSVNVKLAGTIGTNGNTLEPGDLSGLMAEIEELDHSIDEDGWVWIMRGKMWRNILNRRADAVSAADNAGQFLFAVNREDIRLGQPKLLLGHPVHTSGTVPNNRVKGSGTDLSMIIGMIPSSLVVGRVGVLEVASTNSGTVNSNNLFETDQAAVRVLEHIDFGFRHETAVGFIDDIDMDLPSGVI